MRISDWSSDVCSSDLYLKRRGWNEKAPNKAYMRALRDTVMSLSEVSEVVPGQSMTLRDLLRDVAPVTVREHGATQTLVNWDKIAARVVDVNGRHGISRSEEHTSELQSLMRISYAVFFLKNK